MTNVNERTITADEGCMLTNGTVYAKSVRLGDWDSADNWHKISVEEYHELCRDDLRSSVDAEESEVLP